MVYPFAHLVLLIFGVGGILPGQFDEKEKNRLHVVGTGTFVLQRTAHMG